MATISNSIRQKCFTTSSGTFTSPFSVKIENLKGLFFQSCRCFVDCHLVFQLVLCRLTEHASRAKMDNFQLAKKPDNCLLMDIVLLGNINTYLLQKVSVEAHIELSI